MKRSNIEQAENPSKRLHTMPSNLPPELDNHQLQQLIAQQQYMQQLQQYAAAGIPTSIGYPQQMGQWGYQQQYPGMYNHMAQQMHAAPMMGYQAPPPAVDVSMRTVYIGNLPPDVTMETILDQIKGGMLDQVRILAEKNCCFITFVDSVSCSNFYNQAQTRPIVIGGSQVKVGWGKQSRISPNLMTSIAAGASRCVFIGDIAPHMDAQFLYNAFMPFGYIDQIKIVADKKLAFVHLASVSNAIKAVSVLQSNPDWVHQRINYGKDRCSDSSVPAGSRTNPFQLQNTPNTPSFTGNGTHARGNGIRTIYLGGVPPTTHINELFEIIRGGILQNIKFKPEKQIAFVTFIYAEAAAIFYSRATSEGLFMLNGKRLKVGWGNVYALPGSIKAAVDAGATRCVYLGNVVTGKIGEQKNSSDFEEFGEIESVLFVNAENGTDNVFIYFTDIQNAIKAVEVMRTREEYAGFKVNFGKDRCAGSFSTASNFNPKISAELEGGGGGSNEKEDEDEGNVEEESVLAKTIQDGLSPEDDIYA